MKNVLKYWKPESFEISSYNFRLESRINQSYKTSGSDNSGLCTYTYNELGFRGDSIKKQGFKVMSIGCSLTEGVGVNDDETWPHYFSKLVSNGVDMNFGTGGRSNDFIVRCLMTYYDMIKPDLVLIMYTSPMRREYYTNEGKMEPFIPVGRWGWFEHEKDGRRAHQNLCELQNNNEDLINWYKNHQLIKLFLENKKCNWLWNGWFGIPTEYNEFNRFDTGYTPVVDYGADGSHPGPLTHKSYANRLYEHIKLNFPNYLDFDGNHTKKII